MKTLVKKLVIPIIAGSLFLGTNVFGQKELREYAEENKKVYADAIKLVKTKGDTLRENILIFERYEDEQGEERTEEWAMNPENPYIKYSLKYFKEENNLILNFIFMDNDFEVPVKKHYYTDKKGDGLRDFKEDIAMIGESNLNKIMSGSSKDLAIKGSNKNIDYRYIKNDEKITNDRKMDFAKSYTNYLIKLMHKEGWKGY